jgi:hypothetical protein
VYGDLNAPIVLIDAGVILEGNCMIKPKEDAVSQTDRMLSTNAGKTENPMKSSRKQSGSAKNNGLGTSTQE